MFYLHDFGRINVQIKRTYDQFFFYRWCNEAFTALSDHRECTKDYERADYVVASATLRCVSFAVIDRQQLLMNLAVLASREPHKKIVAFDLTDLPYPNFRGVQVIVCKSAFHGSQYFAESCVAIPQFPRYTFDDIDIQPASQRKYLAGFKGDPRPGASTLRTKMLELNNDKDIIVKGAVLSPDHVMILPSGKATEKTPPGEWSYVDILRNSTFALLPRACGYALSYRMIESMNLGCVPVVISDGYVLPFSEVLDYDTFSIRIREDEITSIPDILRERVTDADRLQFESRRVYREYFSSTATIISKTLAIVSRLQRSI